MINAIPIIGWILSLIFAMSMAVPFWIAWTICEIGPTYFYFLPEVYHRPGFWACVGFFTVCWVLKSVIVPNFASVTQSADRKGKER